MQNGQSGHALLVDVSATKKGQHTQETSRSTVVVGYTTAEESNQALKIYAGLNLKTKQTGIFNIKYESVCHFPMIKNKWNIDQLLEENSEVKHESTLSYGPIEQTQEVLKVHGRFWKTPEQKKSVKESPEYKWCKTEQINGKTLAPVCREVQKQAASMDKMELEVLKWPKTWDNSSLIALSRGMLEYYLFGQISYETVAPQPSLKVKAVADRYSMFAHANISLPSGEILKIQNIHLHQTTRDFFPLPSNTCPFISSATLPIHTSPYTCVIEPKFVNTFDNVTFPYEINDCEHVLFMDGSKTMPVAVLARKVQEGKKEVRILSGEAEILIKPQQGSKMLVQVNGQPLMLIPGQMKPVKSQEGFIMVEVKLYQDNVFEVRFPQHGFHVNTDGLKVEIVSLGITYSRAVGVCGDMNGEKLGEVKTPGQCVVRPQIGAVSYILNKSGAQAGEIAPRCEGIPTKYRDEYKQDVQKCLKEKAIPSPMKKILSMLPAISKPVINTHVVMKQSRELCVSKQMVKLCQNSHPVKMAQKVVDLVCVPYPSEEAESLEKRALAGQSLISELSMKPVSLRKVEFEPISCSALRSAASW